MKGKCECASMYGSPQKDNNEKFLKNDLIRLQLGELGHSEDSM